MKMVIKGGEINSATILIDDLVDSPIYIGCRFSHCTITVMEMPMMRAFESCIFDMCEIDYGDEPNNIAKE